jgi:hypothetical protein
VPVPEGTVITSEQAAVLGITRAVLRGPAFRRLAHGLYATSSTANSFLLWARAAIAVCPEGSALCGATALRVWGVALPDALDSDRQIHVAVPAHGTPPQRAFLTAHCVAGDHARVKVFDGMRVVAPVDAWIEVCPGLGAEDRVLVGDALMRYDRPLATPGEIEATLERWAGRRGVGQARGALALMRPGTESIQESRVRLAMVAAGLPEPDVSYVVRDGHARFVARVDMVLLGYKVIIEYDGAYHADERVRRKDAYRRRDLEALGFRVVVATARDAENPAVLIRAIREAIEAQKERFGLA